MLVLRPRDLPAVQGDGGDGVEPFRYQVRTGVFESSQSNVAR